MLDNHLDMVSALVGLGLSARIQVAINTAYRGTILTHILNNSGAHVALVEAAYIERIAEVAADLTSLETVVVRGKASDARLPAHINMVAFDALMATPLEAEDVAPWDLCAIMYTSGTTGLSKGVMIPHGHAYGVATPAVYGAAEVDDVNLVMLPLFHATGQFTGLYNALIAGASAVILPKFTASRFWDKVRAYGCTYTNIQGTIAQFLLNQPPRDDDRDHPMRIIGMGPLIAELDQFKERFGVSLINTGYGSTEFGCVTQVAAEHARPGLVGWPRTNHCEIRIVDENDLDVPEGEVGELVVRNVEPWTVMVGYHDMPAATASAWKNLWFHTGDRMRRDASGQLVFIDRNNDAIRRRGENISSFEVEREINAHPAVFESAVIAAPTQFPDDEVKACVVLQPGSVVDAEGLHAWLEMRIPAFMVPRYIEFMDDLPKTPTEKVQKAILRATVYNDRTWDRLAGAKGHADI